jgi:hypothetical protein
MQIALNLENLRQLHSLKERVPFLCDSCWACNPDKFDNGIQESFASEKNAKNLIPVCQKAIHYQFDHQLAFCYFYLLWIILNKNNLPQV